MSKHINQKQKSSAGRFLFVLRLLMFGFYLILGLMVIFWKAIPMQLSQNLRILFGVVLIGYSFLRFIRLQQENKEA